MDQMEENSGVNVRKGGEPPFRLCATERPLSRTTDIPQAQRSGVLFANSVTTDMIRRQVLPRHRRRQALARQLERRFPRAPYRRSV
jgi:hypothetical protein